MGLGEYLVEDIKKLKEDTWTDLLQKSASSTFMVTINVGFGILFLLITVQGSLFWLILALYNLGAELVLLFFFVRLISFQRSRIIVSREKIFRHFLLLTLALLLSFAALYKAHGGVQDASNSFDYFYYSTVTFTTLGYGDMTPTGLSKLFAALQAIVGFALMPILVSILLQPETAESEELESEQDVDAE